MLRACRRALKPDGRIAYFNIFISHDIPEGERRKVAKAGYAERYTRARQQDLLRSAGFVGIQETDVTDEYFRLQRALYEANQRHAPALRRALGGEQFEERQTSRERALQDIEAGALKRSLFVAERPMARRRARPPRSAW